MAKTRSVTFNGVNAYCFSTIRPGLKSNNFTCKINQFPVIASSDFKRVYFRVGTITLTGLLICHI